MPEWTRPADTNLNHKVVLPQANTWPRGVVLLTTLGLLRRVGGRVIALFVLVCMDALKSSGESHSKGESDEP